MADKNKKDGEDKDDGAKKKGLPAIVLVAVGAALGGAGVVFAVPPKVVEVAVEKPKLELIDVRHPDVLDFTFNPTSKTGRGIAAFKIKFVYTVREDREEEALEHIKSLDPEGLYNTVVGNRISMCGIMPTTVALVAALALGAKKAELVRYTDSGEASGDTSKVVGYAGLVIS